MTGKIWTGILVTAAAAVLASVVIGAMAWAHSTDRTLVTHEERLGVVETTQKELRDDLGEVLSEIKAGLAKILDRQAETRDRLARLEGLAERGRRSDQ